MEKKRYNNIDLNILEERSDKVREILGKPPNKFIRSGTTSIVIIVLLLLLSTAIISYNDIIPAKISITSRNPPVYIQAKSSGKLTEVFASQNQKVATDEILAEIENTATLEDVIYLKERIVDFVPYLDSLDSLRILFPPYIDLGEIQMAYGEFITRYQNFILYNSLTPDKKEAAAIRKQLGEQRSLLTKQKRQLQFFHQDLELSNSAYERNQQLFKKGVISKAEYENASRQYLTDRQQYEGFKTSISETQMAIANYNNLLIKSDIQGEEYENSYRQQLERAHQNLNNELLQWEQKYVLRSPIDGTVTVFDIWNKNQNVSTGETIFTIIPENLEEIIGRVTLPIRNSGKVSKGQKVIIKLANYPFREWGSLEGRIKNISEVPKQGEETYYMVYVSVNSLNTSYNKTIDFKQEMQGSAEIVIEELSILQRIFFNFRDIFDRS